MEKQIGFSEMEYGLKRKKTRREVFLERMTTIIPMELICETIRPYYYVKGNGREPIALEVMVRMYLISQWYNLSDEAAEDLIYENQAVRKFVGIDLSYENAPDRTTLGKFRKLLAVHGLNAKIFEEMNNRFKESGVVFSEGAIIDATIIEAPDSRKNKEKKKLDEEMSTTKKNNRYYYGFKAHISADKESGIVTKLSITTAKVSDVEAAATVLTGKETSVGGDAGYIGIEHRPEVCEKFKDTENPGIVIHKTRRKRRVELPKMRDDVQFEIARKMKPIKDMPDGEEKELLKAEEKRKSSIRAKVEHPFRIMKHVFGFRKTRLMGLEKNLNKLYILFSLVNAYFVMQQNDKAAKK